MEQIVWHFEGGLDLADFTLMRPLVASLVTVSGGVSLREARSLESERLLIVLVRQGVILTDLVVVFSNYLVLDRETCNELTV